MLALTGSGTKFSQDEELFIWVANLELTIKGREMRKKQGGF
jgi:hypothetical protein